MKSLNKFKPNILIMIVLAFICFEISCKKFVQIPPAPNLIVTSQVFADSTDANSAILALYITMSGGLTTLGSFNGNITAYTGLSSDELYPNNPATNVAAIYSNSLLSTNTNTVVNFWPDMYSEIYKANACIEGVSGSSGLSTTAKNQFIGESKVVRALCYFNLVNLFGDVPLITTTDYKTNAVLPRTATSVVYQQIIADLIDAQNLLSANYPTAGKLRANKYTATALLAKAYLYQKQWVQAETSASQIISSGNYSLEPTLNNVFLTGSKEAILQLSPTLAGYETGEGYVFVPKTTTVIPSYIISNFLFSAFEPNDQRMVNWLNKNTVNGTSYYYPFKYKLGQDNSATFKESYMVFRLAEQYLIRAEARAQQGNLPGAIADLNIIRARAGLPNTTATTQTSLLTAIYHERQVELFCEWGNRWYDLKRTGTIDAVMSIVTPAKGGIAWNSYQQLYPIAFTEIQKNPFLVQNPNY